ncbi:7,8-didemethyl-8-hydroxy-5-deazariboflavin synthase subunit CofG [[Limnothrix rosea] IAM M-220]|uniref:7,8-didemethyl-8-hydroxy-5-deazariboflavin synthase subunit CofG n=1 Tax=[Limnothrix rosea] IAM M-220 TaxID=454133 RepID=UPI000966772C|nr:7,8-didemethyl-8-hydroxy-5-deazariboflavin synthase subunit CofG [[Limnothrix rosea] IAM M-220]OKH11109.1 7,8-didemethyl-8-hydroxy-5-deazariboflavin synthase subunit CofG [[Limnothrix rosea] IAM M-220]
MSSIDFAYHLFGDRHPSRGLSTITYSPAFTLVPTYECFNRCAYCNFRVDPNRDNWLGLEEAASRLRTLENLGIYEILILSGEVHPRSPRRLALMQRIKDLCLLALDFGFVPHTNAGPLSFAEMQCLREVNGSMGLMLEQLRDDLPVHRQAPSKHSALRMQQLAWAGELKIPFTTGLLLGIGEDEGDWAATLAAIATVHQKYGHIQEVILQPHSPGTDQIYDGLGFDPQRLPEVIALAREILPEAIAIQIPPNLVADLQWLLRCVEAGASDLGGIVPKDEVNPDYEHLDLDIIRQELTKARKELRPRLAVYPQFDAWLPSAVKKVVAQLRRSNLEVSQAAHLP